MKRTAIFAMLAVFALLATPLLTTNANADTVEDPIVIDTTGADWDYRVYGDGNGNLVIEQFNFGQDDELQDFSIGDDTCLGVVYGRLHAMAQDGNEICLGVVYGRLHMMDQNGNMYIRGLPNNEIHDSDWDYRVYGVVDGDVVSLGVVYGRLHTMDQNGVMMCYTFIIFKDGSDGKSFAYEGGEITLFGINEYSYEMLGTGNLYEEIA